jgi:prepilin-type N-terminal cleavage/methylation domain-containing protein
MMSYLRKRDKGFTLLEVMLVVIIIGIIAIIALPRLLVTKTQAEEESCDSNLQAIRLQLECFEWDNGHYPNCATASDFVSHAQYPVYWPETSDVSAFCPGGTAGVQMYTYTASTGEMICASNHPAN